MNTRPGSPIQLMLNGALLKVNEADELCAKYVEETIESKAQWMKFSELFDEISLEKYQNVF